MNRPRTRTARRWIVAVGTGIILGTVAPMHSIGAEPKPKPAPTERTKNPGAQPPTVPVAVPPGSTNTPARSRLKSELPITTVQGRVVCLPEELHQRHDFPVNSSHEHLWGFRATNGALYTILPGRYAEAIFLDERIRTKELQLRVRIPPESLILEVQTIRSVRSGVTQDLYYYCNICAIKSVTPAICACCQAEVELVEKPLSSDRD